MDKLLTILLIIVMSVVSPVEALGVGDGLAIVLAILIAIVAICALLGFIARKLNR